MNQSFPIPAGLLHVETFLEKQEEWAAVLRFFRHPLAEIDQSSGQPKQDMDWCCTLWKDGERLWIKGVMHLPELSVVRAMIRTARQLPGVRKVAWDTLDCAGWSLTETIFLEV